MQHENGWNHAHTRMHPSMTNTTIQALKRFEDTFQEVVDTNKFADIKLTSAPPARTNTAAEIDTSKGATKIAQANSRRSCMTSMGECSTTSKGGGSTTSKGGGYPVR